MSRTSVLRRDSGASLPELLVVLAIVSAAVGVATGLMVEAQRRALAETSRILDMAVPIALRRLKVDVMAAASFDVGDGSCSTSQSEDPLELYWPSGNQRVTYELSETRLLRKLNNPAGERVVLEGVHGFRWKCSQGSKPRVWIELFYERTRLPGPEVDQGRRVFVHRGNETQVFEIALRGAGGAGGTRW